MVRMTAVATQAQFGEVVGISQPAVSDLLSRGVLTEEAPLTRWILEYCSNLREVAAGRQAAGDLDLATERAALARAQREKIEMQNAVTRRELAPTHLIEEVLARAGTRVAGILDAIPGQIRRRLPDLPGSELDAIALEIAKARNIAADVSLEDLNDATEQGAPDAACVPESEVVDVFRGTDPDTIPEKENNLRADHKAGPDKSKSQKDVG